MKDKKKLLDSLMVEKTFVEDKMFEIELHNLAACIIDVKLIHW